MEKGLNWSKGKTWKKMQLEDELEDRSKIEVTNYQHEYTPTDKSQHSAQLTYPELHPAIVS